MDFILQLEGQRTAIECKFSESVSTMDVNTINKIDKYYKKIKKIIIYRGTRELKEDGVWILPLAKAMQTLGL